MKKIGFVDYYISEWHANNYPAWIKEACEKDGLEYQVGYVWAELDTSPLDGKTTNEWCKEFGAEPCETIEELCEKSDVIVILSPSFPEKHLGYAKAVLPYGKPTYIDKTFAPDYKTAKEIFALGEKYGTKFFSSSALRYAEELSKCENCNQMINTGSGRSVDEYIIHQIEMVVAKLGIGATAVKAEKVGEQLFFNVKYPDSRAAAMIFGKGMSFTIYMNNPENNPSKILKAESPFFKNLIADILRFFETGKASFDTNETLEAMAIRETALIAAEAPDAWVEIKRD